MRAGMIEPNTYVALRLPSDTHSIVQVKPNTTIHIGKYGFFQANNIIGRPYYLTFEILDQGDQQERAEHGKSGLRIVSASELHAADLEDHDAASEVAGTSDDTQYDVVDEYGKVVMRTNQHIIDDANTQVLSMEEIEKLKASNMGSGKAVVAKILESHSALDKKTAFALAKYTLRKTKKYLKRFTILPLDVGLLAKWTLHEKDAGKVMEMREETLALIRSWSNIHYTPIAATEATEIPIVGGGRWLVVDETAGLLTAYLAEQMGLLQARQDASRLNGAGEAPQSSHIHQSREDVDEFSPHPQHLEDVESDNNLAAPSIKTSSHLNRYPPASHTNTLTIIHSLSQPNLSFLRYFEYDVFNPSSTHPLTPHLRTLSWLQLLDPTSDSAYQPPASVTDSEIATWKPSKRGNYYRKLRRYERTKLIVDSTRAGGFDGLIIASVMKPSSILHHLVPLLRGSAQAVIYSPHLEPVAELADLYSTARKTAFLNNPIPETQMPTEDFPVDPRLLLAPTVQTVRAKGWQVLPGRTHPFMTGRGGAEGYVFTATRVLPSEGIRARGNFSRKRKVGKEGHEGGQERYEAGIKKEDSGSSPHGLLPSQ